MSRFLASRLAVAFAVFGLLSQPLAAQAESGRPAAVLVTGASSGIGRSIAELLASKGHFVYAGARKQEDIAALSAIPNIQGIRLDVTSPADIAAAVETVKKGGRGLYGIVNNAGVAIVGPLIEMEDKDLAFIFDVNVHGPVRITRAFAPLLIQSKGRVTTVSSISGILSGPMLGAYSMSKHAIEAYADALAAEMARFGVKSSLIEPGNYRSEIGRNTVGQIEAHLSRNPDSPFREQMGRMVQAMGNYDNYPEPTAVAEAALHALFDPAPRMRYMVVPVARQGEVTVRKAIEEAVQLNQGHAYSLDRDALIRMLDSALVRVGSSKP